MEHYRSQPPELAASLSRIIMLSMLEPLPAMLVIRYTALYVAATGDDYRSSPLQTMVALLTIRDGPKRARDGVSNLRIDLQFSLQHFPKGILSVHYLLLLCSPPIYKLQYPPYPTLLFIKLPSSWIRGTLIAGSMNLIKWIAKASYTLKN
ncbi:hypothetical protein ASPTUDRAFT_777355 [Aspergillus tubingensis CBS 134.48]|uniref:Uncharacterized protein n=1 Tax=Aspergillus tubingensis (strain CBS 134.48) TaxID=767770 RepID=A0A1L9MZF7_ASPTC|nr:hypothetical protein ASPTUDRAFT_777355 [Aspergillus tubingensis CBS 134.48]